MQATQTRSQSLEQVSSQEVNAKLQGINVSSITSIRLPEGQVQVSNCEFVHFSLGIAQSPIEAQRFVPALRYKDQSGKYWTTPLKQIYGYSDSDSQQSR
jgi:hypothetical protein